MNMRKIISVPEGIVDEFAFFCANTASIIAGLEAQIEQARRNPEGLSKFDFDNWFILAMENTPIEILAQHLKKQGN